MGKIISRDFINKNLTGVKLNAKVGSVKMNGKAYRGVGLKKFIISNLGAKTPTLIEKTLKDKYGVGIEKRKRLMEQFEGDKKNGLTEEKIQKNLRYNKAVDRSALEEKADRFDRGNKSLSILNRGTEIKGTAKDLKAANLPNNIGFAGGSLGQASAGNKK